MIRAVALLCASCVVAAACGDPSFTAYVRNDSNQTVVVKFTPDDPQRQSVLVEVPSGATGSAISGGSNQGWRGSVTVMTLSCAETATQPIMSDLTLTVITRDLTVKSADPIASDLSMTHPFQLTNRC